MNVTYNLKPVPTVNAGAKERMVQITGPSEENIERAKELIENTIKRNASPVPFECPHKPFESNLIQNQNSSEVNVSQVFDTNPIQKSSDSIIEIRSVPKMAHTFNVEVDNDLIVLSTNNYELGFKAQQLLEQILLQTPKETVPPKETHKYENRDSLSDSTSGDDFDVKPKQNTITKETKPVVDIDIKPQVSASDLAQNESKHIKIQRSSSQGTVPIGRTSLRFMNKLDEKKSKSIDKNYPKYTYDRQILMALSELESSKNVPNIETMVTIYQKTPDIIRKHPNSGQNSGLVKSESFTQNANPIQW